MRNARNGRIESQGRSSLPQHSRAPQIAAQASSAYRELLAPACSMQECAQGSVLLSLQPLRAGWKKHSEIFLWSQWITHILKALISLAGQIAFSGFHTKGCEIAADDCLHLFSDRKWRRAVGPMIRSVQTDTGNSKQISHRGMWTETREEKTFASLCPANPGNSSECVLTSSKSVSYPVMTYLNCKVCGFNWDIWTLWDSTGER